MHETIVSVEQVTQHLNDRAWVIVDCRHLLQDFAAGRRMYEAAHIPGAFFVSAEDELSGPRTGKNGRHPLPDAQTFAALLRELGVNGDSQIVAYDAGADMWAARFWFVCKYIGHAAVAVLDGGFGAWTGMGKPVSAQIPARPCNGSIVARPQPQLTVDANAVLASLENNAFSLVDARGPDRFEGRNENIDPVGGHIPGAVNRPFRWNYTGPFGQFKAPDDLRKEFDALGIAPQNVVHQCGSGVTATVNLLAMELAGLHGARVYPGSWSEWCADPSRPMVKA